MGQIEARSKKIAFRKAIPFHALLFNTRLPRLKTHKKHETTIYCAAFILDTQGHFRYTLLQKVDSHHHGADAQEMPCDDAYGKKVFTIRKALLKAVHYKWRSLIHLITSAWSKGVMS
jgi:hypothetical protein